MKRLLSSIVYFILSVRFTGAANGNFYSYSVRDINGQNVDLKKYHGSISLVVNVASECGYTDGHYKDLVKLHETLSPSGKFQVLAFPCNQFGGQEPSPNEKIASFAKTRYKVSFPMFGKIDVIGDNVEPAFKDIVDQSEQEPTWNFWKYLVNGQGRVVGAWGPQTSVQSIWSRVKGEVDTLGKDTNRVDL